MGNYSSSYMASQQGRKRTKNNGSVKSKTTSSSNSGKKRGQKRFDDTSKMVPGWSASVCSEESSQGPILRQSDPVPDSAPAEMKVVREYLRYKDVKDVTAMRTLTAEKCFFNFVDAEALMLAREFYDAMGEISASFPDLHFFWDSMKIAGHDPATGGTVVVVDDYYGIGKHTGPPYGFGPYETIPATGITVQDEKIEFTFIVKDGKIIDAKIDAFGKMVGPPGFYSKIGGIIL